MSSSSKGFTGSTVLRAPAEHALDEGEGTLPKWIVDGEQAEGKEVAMSLYQRGKSWYYDFQYRGERYTGCIGAGLEDRGQGDSGQEEGGGGGGAV